MKQIPAFSKKSTGPGIVTGTNKTNYQRPGFTKHVTVTTLPKVKAAPGMAGPSKGDFKQTKAKGNPSHPAHNNSGQGGKIGKNVPPAFSKKKI